jgi:hypothetical protein
VNIFEAAIEAGRHGKLAAEPEVVAAEILVDVEEIARPRTIIAEVDAAVRLAGLAVEHEA